MSDGVPSEEQRRRIERGVLDRIDARRRRARSIAGGAVAVVLLAGGVGVLARGVVQMSSSSSAGGSAAGSGEGTSAHGSIVRATCALASGSDSGGRSTVAVRADALPGAAVLACGGRPEMSAYSGLDDTATPAAPDSGTTTDSLSAAPSPTPEAASARPPAALCVDVDGGLIVIARTGTSDQACTRAGLRRWER